MRLFLYSAFLLVFAMPVLAQIGGGDTLPYTIGKFDIKKQDNVLAIARKLKVDPAILVKLNKFRNEKSVLAKGQRIKIPIYTKGYRYSAGAEPVHIGSGQNMDTGNGVDSVKLIASGSAEIRDTEKDKVRLMMIDATLELNEAMMEGAKASLDSMEPGPVDPRPEKDPRLKQHRLKLERDRSVLMPYILHIQDSLMQDITALKAEKSEIENRISPPVIEVDTVIAGSDLIIYETIRFADGSLSQKTVKQVIPQKLQVQKADGEPGAGKEGSDPGPRSGHDETETSPQGAKTEHIAAEHKAANPAKRPGRKNIPGAVAGGNEIAKDTAPALKIMIPNSNDSFVIKPIVKPRPVAKLKAEPGRRNSAQRISNPDSVKRIKAEFFFQRAQGAIDAKNFALAEQNLNKSIELYPDYFEAWFALSDIEERRGSPQKALDCLMVCKRIDSTQPRLFYTIGNLYSKLKRKTEAYEAFSRTILLKSDDLPALMARASILTDRKNYAEAISDYTQVLRVDRLYYRAYKDRGQVKLLTKEFASAADDFTLFLLFETKDASAYYYRGLAKIGNGDQRDGCTDLSTSSQLGYSSAEKAIKKSCE